MQIERIDSYEPDWKTPCEVCGQLPSVTAVRNGKVVMHIGMCGPCAWGEKRTIDPSTWNDDGESEPEPAA